MGIENVVAERVADDPNRMGGTAAVPANKGKARRTAKDIAAQAKLHSKLMNWLQQERQRQAQNRMEMATDEDFYDGLQWSDDEVAELLARSQAPIVFNQIKPTINWLLGTERRTRFDGKVLPREESDETGAEVKTKLLKYLSDVNRTQFKRSQAFKSQVVAGLGWMEDAINTDPSEELLVTRYVDWKNIYHDSHAKELDLSDARYIFRWGYHDLDVAIALCPKMEHAIRSAAIDATQIEADEDDVWYMGSRVNTSSSGDYASTSNRGMGGGLTEMGRDQVKLIECWYKEPVACKVCRSHDPEGNRFNGEVYDPTNEAMAYALQEDLISVVGHVRMEVRVAIMTESVVLYHGASPYKHNRLPFTPFWCYRRHRDLMPYGVIRDIRDAQIDYNKRASKALFILSTVRVTMDEDAMEDIEEVRREAARPNAVFSIKRGSRFDLDTDKSLAEQHLKLMQFDGQMIRDVGGVTDQNLGKDDKGLSGQAIGKLQDQGSIVTAALFDNFRLGIQMQTELQLSLMEQFYTAPKVVRLIGENKPIEWLKINVYDEGAGQYINDITRSKADFIVSEQDFKASIREAMFQSMMDLIAKLPPEVGLQLLDMVIDFADVPNKEEIVARVRKINGQRDPSTRPTPEEELAQQERDAKAKQMEDIQLQTAQAQLEETQAKVEKLLADVQKQAAETQKTVAHAVELGVKAAYEALQAAQIVTTIPGTTPAADAILAGAGYQQQGGDGVDIPTPEQQAVVQQEIDQMAGAQPRPVDPRQMELPELQQADGVAAGIETPAPDGVQPQ